MVRKSSDFYAEKGKFTELIFTFCESQQSNSKRKELFPSEIKLNIKAKDLTDS